MPTALRSRVSKLHLFSTVVSTSLPHLYQSLCRSRLVLAVLAPPLVRLFGSLGPMDEEKENPPDSIPNRPLRGDRNKPVYASQRVFNLGDGEKEFGNGSEDDCGQRMKRYSKTSPSQSHDDFLEKFKLGFDEGEKEENGEQAVLEPPPPPQDADEIFNKMRQNGLVPNAVAMLDGLCKDGMLQEAMKLFWVMREKGTIPEIVVYTAVVDGYCKAHKLDDAKRIFRKMQSDGISPNAFSYTVLIQGLYRVKMLDDALDFCVEMLEAGHSLNLSTFTGLVDGFCKEKGVEEAQGSIGTLRQKGFHFDEKAVREYLNKKGPFSPLVWEAIYGKKNLKRFF